MPILIIARLTLYELLRRRVILAGLVLTLIILLLTTWGFQSLPNVQCGRFPCTELQVRGAASVLLILVMFMFSFIIALGAAFIAAPAIASDVESGIALAMLPRPIRRRDVVLGKWLALAGAIVLYTVGLCAYEIAIVNYFIGYQPPDPTRAIAFVAAEGVALLTLALLGSTRLGPMASGIIAVVLFGVNWVAGIVGSIGVAFENQTATNVGVIASLILPTDGLWRGALYNLQPALLTAAAAQAVRLSGPNPFFVGAPPTTPYLVWAALWIVALLGLAVYSFERREL
jgi:ABC-type transport system involved in multi-copper enzyme maturation permease subunit